MELTKEMLHATVNNEERLNEIVIDLRKRGIRPHHVYFPLVIKTEILKNSVAKMFPIYDVSQKFEKDFWGMGGFAYSILDTLEKNIQDTYYKSDFWKSFPEDDAIETVLDLERCYFRVIKRGKRKKDILIQFIMPVKK